MVDSNEKNSRNTKGSLAETPTETPTAGHEISRRLRASLALAEIGLWDWDLESGTIWRSPKYNELLGLPSDDNGVTLQFESLMQRLHPHDRGLLQQALSETLNNGAEFRCEYRVILPDHNIRWISSVGQLVEDRDGRANFLNGVAIDISAHKDIEMRLQRALEDAESATEAKNQFLANISHEIRTPLGAIIGFADFISDPSQTKSENRECAKTIKRNGEQLLSLVDELLDISKVETAHLQIEKTKFSLSDTLKDISSLMGFKAREKGLTLEFAREGRIPHFIKTDPTRLRQILLNVIGNAIKFTERGRVKVTIRSAFPLVETDPARLIFEVEDSGIGLTEQQAARLFQPFMQADSSTTRRFGGTGLGLALAKRLAIALGGNLNLTETQLGGGSTFTVEITCGLMDEITFQDQPQETTAPPQTKSPLRGIRVLLVDDARDNQVLLSQVLKRAGAQVLVASNGQDGLDQAIGGNFDIVLMDIQMPGGLDGHEATSRLRARGYKKPIIALTAHSRNVDRERSFQVGCDDHLTKPVDKNTLVEAIEHFAGPSARHASQNTIIMH